MNEFTSGLLMAIIPAVIVAMISSYITVRLSKSQFYSQKWWEKKEEAYSNLIEQISYLLYYFEKYSEHSIGIIEISEQERKQMEEEYRVVQKAVKKSAAVGSFIVSELSAKALTELIKELDIEKVGCHMFDNFDRWFEATKSCINIIRKEAIND
ncbi:hypothetical protein [Paenibacillus sp. NPDC058071]|uniref:hypothetical protein n=1 Tax=Paenibacillus sp. NPDC058071 TaxID=3346326 RepID=UPI0036D9A65E